MSNCKSKRVTCKTSGGKKPAGLKELVKRFKTEFGACILGEEEMFRRMPSFDLAIHHVAMATDDEDVCFDHQRRIIPSARRQAKVVLTASKSRLKACESFHELYELLNEILDPVPGVGALYIYDAALRMGAYLRLAPKRVYLHAGTRDGARALGLAYESEFLELHQLPVELRGLTADQAESFLCIYKDCFI